MLDRLPVRRHVRRLALLTLAALALAALPGLPASAQATTTQPLDDTQVDFAQGTFQRTAVNAGTVGGDPKPFPDQDGTLELAAAGNLRPWTPTQPGLPVPLAYMGTATLGARLYTVAGVTSGGATAFTDAVYWANIDQQTGALADHGLTTPPAGGSIVNEEWVNDPLAPALAFMGQAPNLDPRCAGETISTRRAPAVASFLTGTGTNYIYVIGGAFNLSSNCGSGTVTSSAVQIGAVNAATGDITWSSNPTGANYLPSQNLPNLVPGWADVGYRGVGAESLGVEGATASVVTTGSGQTYLYVIGGLATYDQPFGLGRANLVTPAVFYTRLNPSTGAFEYPLDGGSPTTPWARAANVPLNEGVTNPPPPGELGLYNHAAIVSRAVVGQGTGTTVSSAIFVTGGYTTRPSTTTPSTAQATVFRATIRDDGTLTWATALNPDPAVTGKVSIESGRAGLGGFAFGNKLYLLGGTPTSSNDDPLGSATLGVHDDRMNMLPLFGTSNTPVYFTGGQSEVIDPAYGLGAAVVTATPPPGATTIANAGWGYTIGGNSIPDGQTSAVPSATIFRGPIGGSAETAETIRIPDGWYYSRFFNIRFESDNLEARILSVRWFTGIDRAANLNSDLRLEFQRTKVLPCNEAAFADSEWVPLDGSSGDGFSSKDGFNEVKLRDIFPTEDFSASCFRYRAYMTQNGSAGGVPNPAGNANRSPQLFSINVEKIKPGDPDLKLEAFEIGPDDSGRIATFDLKITNLNDNVLNTIAIAQERFPVVLCVAYSETDPNVTLTVPDLPVINDPDARVNCAPVYRWIDSSETIPGQVFTLNNNWQVNFDNVVHIPGKGQGALLSDPKEAFAVPGHYAVAVLLDPFGLVPEGGAAKTNNRGENLNNGQPLVRRFTITEAGFLSRVYLPRVNR